MSTPIYISFYEFDEPGATEEGSFHWGIALPRPENQNRLSGPVDIFQVGTPDDEDVETGADPDAWEANHRTADRPVDLTKSASFIALVELPPLMPPKGEVEQFLVVRDAGQGNTPLVSIRDEWSCAQWVIRTLQAGCKKLTIWVGLPGRHRGICRIAIGFISASCLWCGRTPCRPIM
ncbi:hypothetical protein CPB85DRAFT_1310015 [Mucidula mucida]|nr:hypothetical protein CPB85DRAFT_1310015 [Mucidula mucida]